MKQRLQLFWLIFISCWFFGSEFTLQAQDAPESDDPRALEVINRYIQALGGKENLLKIKSLEITGLGEGKRFANKMPLNLLIKNPGKNKVEISVMNQKMVWATDGKVSWGVNPFLGKGQARLIPQNEQDSQSDVLYIIGKNLINYKDRGYRAEFLGKVSFQGRKAYHIRLLSDLDEDEYYIDAKSYFLLMAKVNFTKNYYDNYQKVGEIFFPHHLEGIQDDLKIEVDEVKLNEDIDDNEFKMPFSQFNSEEHVLLAQKIENETFDIPQEEIEAPRVIEEFLEVVGYHNPLKSHKSLILKGIMILGSVEVPYIFYKKNPEKFRLETKMLGKTSVLASDGKQDWEVDAFEKKDEPVMLESASRERPEEWLNFGREIEDYQLYDEEAEHLGEAHVKGKACHVIKVIDPIDKREILYFFQIDSHLLVLKHHKFTGAQEFYDDYKVLDGSLIPHKVLRINHLENLNMSIILKEAEFEPKFSNKIFKASTF